MKLADLANSTEMVQLPLFDVTRISQVKITTTSDLHRANSAACVYLQLSSSGTEMTVKEELKESSIWPPVLRQSRKYLFEYLQDLMQFAAFSGRVPFERQGEEFCWMCVSMKFLCWQADHVVLAAFPPEHDPPVLSRHSSLDFLNGKKKRYLVWHQTCVLGTLYLYILQMHTLLGYIIPLLLQCQAE